MNEAPTIYGKHGEFLMPQDIWDAAGEIVASLGALEDIPELAGEDIDEMAQTIIASALYAERAGLGKLKA